MRNVVIVGYARSPFHLAGKGALARVRPDDLAAQVIRGLIERTGVKAEDIEDIVMGCAFPEGEQGFNIARLVGRLADLPRDITSGANAHFVARVQPIPQGECLVRANAAQALRAPGC